MTSSTTTTSQDVKAIQDRQSNGRGAVIAAGFKAEGTSARGIDDEHMAEIIEAAMMALVEHWRAEADIWEASKKRGSVGTAKELRQCASRLAGFAVGLTTRPITSISQHYSDADPSSAFQAGMAAAEGSDLAARVGRLLIPTNGALVPEIVQVPDDEMPGMWSGADLVGGEADMAQATIDALAITSDVVAALPVGDPVGAVLGGDEPVGTKVTVGGVEFTKIGTDPFAVRQDSWTPQASEENALRDIIGPLGASASATALVDNPFTRPNVPWLNRPAVAVVAYDQLPVIAMATGTRDYVSHSYVEGYESCSLAAMLKDASRAGHIGASRPDWSQIAGKAFHAAVEAVERATLAGVSFFAIDATIGDIEAFWMSHFDTEIKEQLAALVDTPYADSGTWYVSNRGKEGFDWWRVEGARMLKLYLDYHTPAWRAANQTFLLQDKTPVIELEYDMTIRSLDQERGLQAKGFIDKATLNMETYSLTVLDYKTGAKDPTSTFQLGEYGHALLMAMGIAAEPPDRPILGSYWLARKGIYTTPTAVLARHPMSELQYRYDQAARGNKAGIFAPHVSNFCTSCSVKDYCPTQAGRT